MRLLVTTDPIQGGFVCGFATYMNMYDDSFAARYLRKGQVWEGVSPKVLEPEAHAEDDKYDIYYVGVRDLEGFMLTCRALPQVRVVAQVNDQYKVIGKPLYVSPRMLSGEFVRVAEGDVVLPENLRERPAGFVANAPMVRTFK